MTIIRKFTLFITAVAAILALAAVLTWAEGEGSGLSSRDTSSQTSYTITFTRGYSFINPLTGTEADHLFTGTVPEPITAEAGGSFIFPENTIKFYDYEFVCWKYSYKDIEGKTVTERYNPGDIYENVSTDMKIDALWKRPERPSLVITGYISYLRGDEYAEGEDIAPYLVTSGKTIKLATCPYAKDGYNFAGWVDSDGILYREGDDYTVNKANPVLTAVWQKNGESILTHVITYLGGEGEVTGKGPADFEMYEKTTFKVAKNTFIREGYEFVHWVDEDGGIHHPGEIIDVSRSGKNKIILTAVWEEVINYYEVIFEIQGEGEITPPGNATVAEGGSYSFTLIPYTGYRIKTVKINGVEQEINNSYTLENITQNQDVLAVFEKIPVYQLNITYGNGGSAYASGDVTHVTEGENITIYLSPDEGYIISSLYINGNSQQPSDNKVVIENVMSDINIVVEFSKKGENNSSIPSEESIPLVVKSPTDMKYIIILAALIVLLTLGFIVFKIKR